MVVFRKFHLLFLVFALLTVSLLNGQQATIKVLDRKTGDPVLYAHVSFEAIASGIQKHGITNVWGEVFNGMNEKSVLTITYVGYETLFDSLDAGQNKTLYLNPAVVNMSEVVVTAQYTPQRIDKSIYKIKVIGVKQIEQKGATNLADLFRDELSMRISQDGTLGSNLSIRGLGGEHVKFLIDGVPVIGRMDGNIDLGQLNLSNVDHIEMIEGPMSVIYGSNAIAGVVNIITRENKNSITSANIDTYFESVGVYNINGGGSAKKKNSTISLSGGRNFFAGYSQNDTSRSKQWKPKRQYFVDGYYIFDKSKYRFKYSTRYFNEILVGKGDLMYPYYETAMDNYFITKRLANSMDFGSRLGKKRFVNILAAYSLYHRIREEYYNDLTTLEKNLTFQDTTEFTDLSARAVISKSDGSGQFNYQFGIDANSEWGKGEKIEGTEKFIGDYAAFLSINYNVVTSLSVQPGIRYIYNTKYHAPLVYSVNVKWLLPENINFRASYSRGFRAPALKELYLDFVDVNHNIKGNENITAENSHNFNLSLNFQKEAKKKIYGANVDLFYNLVNNLIKLTPMTGIAIPNSAPYYTYVNIGKYITNGIQVDLNYSFYPRFSVKAGLTETGRKYGVDEDYQVESEFLYSTDLNFSCTYSILKWNLDISAFYKYTGQYPEFSYDDITKTYFKGFIEDYHIMDVSLMKHFFKRTLKLTSGIKNLFDINTIKSTLNSGEAHSGNNDFGRLTGWGRTFFIGLSYNFNNYQK